MSGQTTFARAMIDGLSPRGSIVTPAPGLELDNLFEGMADGHQEVIGDLEALAYVRDPWKCPRALLSDLEREFGITPNPALTEKDRRANVAVAKYRKRELATVSKLQRALDMAGFGASGYGLIVTANGSPATDPAAIVDNAYQLTAHAIGDGSGSCAGNARAYAAKRGGYYLVNGDTYSLAPNYPQAGQICARAFDGSDTKSPTEAAGYYSTYTLYTSEYPSPPAGFWPLIPFVGGTAARNLDGSIAAISTVWIPAARRQELHRLILRIKPLGIWVAMIVQYQ